MNPPASLPRLAVLVSGSGRHLRNLLERERDGRLRAATALVISSRADAKALDHAAHFGVPSAVLKAGAITSRLDATGVDLVVMAGYLKHWPIVERFLGRAVNIHPSLLPLFGGRGFYGHKVHEAVLASGMRVSGCTVHFVSDVYDTGPIIAQRAVPVLPTDTPDSLAARVFAEELELLPESIRLVLEGKCRLAGGRAVFADAR